MLERLVIDERGFGLEGRVAQGAGVVENPGEVDVFHVVPHVGTVQTGFCTNTAHVLVLRVRLVAGSRNYIGVKIVRRLM